MFTLYLLTLTFFFLSVHTQTKCDPDFVISQGTEEYFKITTQNKTCYCNSYKGDGSNLTIGFDNKTIFDYLKLLETRIETLEKLLSPVVFIAKTKYSDAMYGTNHIGGPTDNTRLQYPIKFSTVEKDTHGGFTDRGDEATYRVKVDGTYNIEAKATIYVKYLGANSGFYLSSFVNNFYSSTFLLNKGPCAGYDPITSTPVTRFLNTTTGTEKLTKEIFPVWSQSFTLSALVDLKQGQGIFFCFSSVNNTCSVYIEDNMVDQNYVSIHKL